MNKPLGCLASSANGSTWSQPMSAKTSLCWLEDDKFQEFAELPSGGRPLLWFWLDIKSFNQPKRVL